MVNDELSDLRNRISEWIRSNEYKLGYDSRRTDPEVVATRYLQVVQDGIGRGFATRSEMDRKLKLYRIELDWCRKNSGRYGPNKVWWWDTLLAEFPVFEIIQRAQVIRGAKKGSPTLSQVKMLYMINWDDLNVWAEVEDYLANPTNYDSVDIDTDSLGNFILQADNARYRRDAERIFEKYEAHRGHFPMLRRPAKSGRVYYGGINLQNTPAVVRRAALGNHHEYDLTTSVYSWQIVMLRLIQNISRYDAPAGSSYTRELIRDKDSVRQNLAHALENTDSRARLSVVKQALTAIGFGARSSTAYYDGETLVKQGLAGVIHDAEDRKRFIKNSWVQAFMAEQDQIGASIVAAMLDANPEYKTDPDFSNSRGRFNDKRFLAFLYQNFETRVMKSVMAHPDVENRQVLLWVHDCIYTRQHINLSNINSELMMDYGDGIRLEHKIGSAWRALAPTAQDEARERAQRHQAEAEWHRSRGRHSDTEYTECQPLPKWRPADEVPLGTYLGYK